jgi:NADPH:quinone reductase-like Zn-dependent oxidoreductase
MRLPFILAAIAAAAPAVALDPTLAERITAESERLAPKLIECRRWFHRHPELSNREHQTAAEIARRLHELGLEPRTGIAGTGVVGLGGLGHMGVKFARAFGAHVVVFTTSWAKKDDALRLGAHEVILSSDPEEMKAHAGTFDFILDTISADHDINAYINMASLKAE